MIPEGEESTPEIHDCDGTAPTAALVLDLRCPEIDTVRRENSHRHKELISRDQGTTDLSRSRFGLVYWNDDYQN